MAKAKPRRPRSDRSLPYRLGWFIGRAIVVFVTVSVLWV
jgi:monofunctional biosynthetic peptidoglycan transglycosylase